jgi:hypothetical protein
MLKAKDVLEEQEYRREKRMAAMRPVLSQIFGQIKRQSIHSADAPYILFEIPTYVFGYPIFQLSEAREYLFKTLEESGFLVWVIDEKYLLISWVKRTAGGTKASYRPQLTTNYRPQVYDPVNLGSMYQQQR